MSNLAVRVEGLGKQYRIGGKPESYKTFRDAVTNIAMSPVHRVRQVLRGEAASSARHTETFWALRDVSFEVKHGEAIGIIGRNGAGKSTLLKILSRITGPTAGQIRLKGRVGALLEVGTGFHPELSGRENIYLNGAILGMHRSEIERKFDEIVAFAEIDKFIDTAVKHYSSGMYLRLAFAVAAHLEPEILVVDEVLAVGDVNFQKKCLGKMSEVSKGGRTVLFVSHNLAAVKTLCSSGLLLERGQIVKTGEINEVVSYYVEGSGTKKGEVSWSEGELAPGNDTARLCGMRFLNVNGESTTDQFSLDESFYVEVEYEVSKPDAMLNVSLSIYDSSDVHVLASASLNDPHYGIPYPKGRFKSRCLIPANFLNTGRYNFSVLLVENSTQIIAQADKIIAVDMIDLGTSRGNYFGYWGGVVRPSLQWQTELLNG